MQNNMMNQQQQQQQQQQQLQQQQTPQVVVTNVPVSVSANIQHINFQAKQTVNLPQNMERQTAVSIVQSSPSTQSNSTLTTQSAHMNGLATSTSMVGTTLASPQPSVTLQSPQNPLLAMSTLTTTALPTSINSGSPVSTPVKTQEQKVSEATQSPTPALPTSSTPTASTELSSSTSIVNSTATDTSEIPLAATTVSTNVVAAPVKNDTETTTSLTAATTTTNGDLTKSDAPEPMDTTPAPDGESNGE